MKGMLDTDAGVQNFEIGRRIRDDNHSAPGFGRRYRLSIGACKVRIRRGLKVRFGRRIGLDKVLHRE